MTTRKTYLPCLRLRQSGMSKMPKPVEKAPIGLAWRSSKWFIIFTVTYAVFTDIFLYSLIIPVVPFSLQERVNVNSSDVSQWISVLIAVYGGSLAATSPLFGWMADHTKTRRAPFLVGLVVLAGATVMLHQGRSIAVLILGRVIQGASAAVVWIVGLALLADTVGSCEVGNAMGYVFIGASLGYLCGPLLGGTVFASSGYDAVFGIAYGIIGIDILLRFILIEKCVAEKWQNSEDTERTNESSPTNEISDKNIEGGVNPPVQTTVPESQTTDRRERHPLITLLRSQRMLVALWLSIVVSTLSSAFESTLPLYVKEIWSWTSEGAGVLFLALVVPSFVSPIVGSLSDRIGPRWLATSGFLLLVPVEVCLRFVEYNSIGQKVLLVALLCLFGVGVNVVSTPVMADIAYVVQDKLAKNPAVFGKRSAYAQAFGLFNLAWATGALIGPFWGGFVRTAAGWGTMTWSLALLSGVSAIPAAIWSGGAIYARHD